MAIVTNHSVRTGAAACAGTVVTTDGYNAILSGQNGHAGDEDGRNAQSSGQAKQASGHPGPIVPASLGLPGSPVWGNDGTGSRNLLRLDTTSRVATTSSATWGTGGTNSTEKRAQLPARDTVSPQNLPPPCNPLPTQHNKRHSVRKIRGWDHVHLGAQRRPTSEKVYRCGRFHQYHAHGLGLPMMPPYAISATAKVSHYATGTQRNCRTNEV